MVAEPGGLQPVGLRGVRHDLAAEHEPKQGQNCFLLRTPGLVPCSLLLLDFVEENCPPKAAL